MRHRRRRRTKSDFYLNFESSLVVCQIIFVRDCCSGPFRLRSSRTHNSSIHAHTAPSMRVDLFWFYGNWNGVNAHRFIIQIERICHFVSQLNRGFSIITKYSSFESKTYRLRCAERPIHTRTHFDFGCCFFFHYYDSSLFKYAKCDFVYEYTREI